MIVKTYWSGSDDNNVYLVLSSTFPWRWGAWRRHRLHHPQEGNQHGAGHGEVETLSGKIPSCWNSQTESRAAAVKGCGSGSGSVRWPIQAYADYMGFILTLNEGVKGKKLTCEYEVSEVTLRFIRRFYGSF